MDKNEMILSVEEEINERSTAKKREILELFEGVRRELDNGEYDIEPSKSIYEQDTEKYKQVLKYVMETGDMKVADIVKKFNIGYIKAAVFIEDFKKKGYAIFNEDKAKYDIITAEQFRKIFPN